MTGSSMAPLWTAVGAVVVAAFSAWVGLRNGTKANRPAESNAQLAWVKQAMDEATAAKAEASSAEKSAKAAERSAKVATRAAEAATDRADDAERRLSSLIVSVDSLIRWAETVIAAAQDPTMDGDQVRAVVNGGPPGFTQAKLALERRRAG